MTVTSSFSSWKPAIQPCMAADWALEPAPLMVPDSDDFVSPPLLLGAAEPVLVLSPDPPQAASASEPAANRAAMRLVRWSVKGFLSKCAAEADEVNDLPAPDSPERGVRTSP